VRVARAKHERRALSREFFSNRATKPLTTRCHECNFVFESEIHLFLPEIVVSLVEPVLTWRTEDVDVESIFECFRFVLDVRRNV
jgi:hypothetical protein